VSVVPDDRFRRAVIKHGAGRATFTNDPEVLTDRATATFLLSLKPLTECRDNGVGEVLDEEGHAMNIYVVFVYIYACGIGCDALITLLAFLLVISVVVAAHEAGHFVAAKLCGIPVSVFSIGFGPRLLATTIRGTEFRLASLPLGGYVRPDAHALQRASVMSRVAVYLAGPAASVVFGVLLTAGMLMHGEPLMLGSRSGVIDVVIANSRAARAGIRAHDVLTGAFRASFVETDDVDAALSSSPDAVVTLSFKRDGRPFDVDVAHPPHDGLDALGLIMRPAWLVSATGQRIDDVPSPSPSPDCSVSDWRC